MTSHEDPGWGPAVRTSGPFLLVPFFPLTAFLLRRKSLDGLTMLRVLFLHFASALVLFLIVLVLLNPRVTSDEVSLPVVLLLGAGWTGSVVGVLWARARPLAISSAEALAGSYRTVFFVSMAFAQSAALFGFVGVFLVGALWPYLLGLAITAYGFSTVAPTAGNLERRQREITATGSDTSLVRALMRSPSDPLAR